jgi:hypothetical protein
MSKNLKPTKRKAFNFLRSYFDVLNELDNDKDKLDFLLSIINKQFLDEDPKELNFIVNLCYESQRHSIESSVKGWKRVNNIDPTTNPTTNPTTDPTTNPEEEEEEVKGEEEEEVKPTPIDYDKFLQWFNTTRTKYLEIPSHINRLTQTDKSNLEILKKSYSNDEFNIALLNLCNDRWANESNLILPNHFLKEENFVKYLNMPQRKLLTKREKQIAGWGV